MTHAASLSDLQRSLPRMDRTTPRRGVSPGGVDQADGPRFQTAPIGPGTAWDSRILRDRGPWMHVESYIPPPITWISWTKAGPVRRELHVRNSTYRREQGASSTRYPVVNSPTTGRHTKVEPTASRTAGRYQAVPQMKPPRQNRLRQSGYAGQTYSQITRTQGR